MNLLRVVKKLYILISFVCYCFFPFISYCQSNVDNLIKTIENTAGKKRREIFLDSNMNVVKEIYFDYVNSMKIAEIFYGKNSMAIKDSIIPEM